MIRMDDIAYVSAGKMTDTNKFNWDRKTFLLISICMRIILMFIVL